MEFSIEALELQRIVKLLSVAARVNTNDTRSMVLIEVDDKNNASFLCDNGNVTITETSEKVQVKTAGTACVIFDKIKSFALAFSPMSEGVGVKDFRFIRVKQEVHVHVENIYEDGKKSKGKVKLKYIDAYNMSKPVPFEHANFILNSHLFKIASSKILYAMSPNETRKMIQGMCIHFDGDNIYFVGTNGRMLSEFSVKNEGDLREGFFILKYDFMMALRRALVEETTLFFEMKDNKVAVKFDNTCVFGITNIGVTYPEYQSNLDKFTDVIKLDKDVLLSNLRPFKDLLDSDDDDRLSISISNNKLTLYNDVATFEYEGVVDYDGDFVGDYNGKFVIQTVEAIQDDSLLIKFSNAEGNIMFDSAAFEDQKALVTHIRRR